MSGAPESPAAPPWRPALSVFQSDIRGRVERSTGLILNSHIYNSTRSNDSAGACQSLVRGYLNLSSQGSVLSSCDGFQVTCSPEDVWDKEEP